MKFDEAIDLVELDSLADFLDFPPQLYRISGAAYRGPRYLSMASQVNGPLCAESGVIAGCSIAASYVRVYVIPT
eukprot:4531803-Pyramimonas_sp.AAC.1